MNDQIIVGRFGSPYGIKGWVKIISFTDPIQKILEYSPWIIYQGTQQRQIVQIKGKLHANGLIGQVEQCHDRDEAKSYTNLDIYIDRAQLPKLTDEEYYWLDLIGLNVENCEQEALGQIVRLFETGSNDVLVVQDESGHERFIPYLDHVVKKVDLQNKRMIVDWDSTF